MTDRTNETEPEILDAVYREYKDALILLSFWDEDEKTEVQGDLAGV